MKRPIAPVHLGCCPGPDRCDLCAPAAPVTLELIEALRINAGETAQVRFYGGQPPTNEQLAVAGAAPWVRVRPDLLTRADAERLRQAGVVHIELDLLTPRTTALRSVGRHYSQSMLEEQAAGLRAMGFRTSAVLAPGLPGTDHDSSMEDARWATRFDEVRLHPVLVIKGSQLAERHASQLYTPLSVSEAVTTCLAMLEILEAASIPVPRIGLQPLQDGYGRAIAGPAHPALRELIEARRALQHLHYLLSPFAGTAVTIRCAPADETRTRGPRSQNIRVLRADHNLRRIDVRPDPALSRGTWRIESAEET